MLSLTAAELLHLKQSLAQKRPGHGLPRTSIMMRCSTAPRWISSGARGWLFAGHSCQIPKPGDYFLYEVDGDSLIIVRGNDGQVRALYNVCRHRGSVICEAAAGQPSSASSARTTSGPMTSMGGCCSGAACRTAWTSPSSGLHTAHAREVEGLIFISLAQEPPDFEPAYETIAPVARPQGLPARQGRQVHGLRRGLQLEAGLGEQPRVLSLQRQPPAVHQGQLRSLQRR